MFSSQAIRHFYSKIVISRIKALNKITLLGGCVNCQWLVNERIQCKAVHVFLIWDV